MKPRKPIVIANWKLNGGLDLICTSVASFIGKRFNAQIAICPPSIYIRDMMTFLQFSDLAIGSQNFSIYASGAYTGETSAQMLKEAGCSLGLIGHSERRAMFGETNDTCHKKVTMALSQSLMPVLCIGENQKERNEGLTEEALRQQLRESLPAIDLTGKDLCIAYEPVWAIGTGLAATPQLAQEVHAFIRNELIHIYDAITANRIRIVYGGSVTKTNATELLSQPDIDGLLVGGASLDPGHFLAICEQASLASSES